jgi:electron transfer flavoprotein beta subunit
MIAEFLDLPAVALVQKLDISGGVATIKREIEGGTETVEVKLPLVICAQKELAEARIPNMKGIMGARSKPLAVVPAAATDKLTTISSYVLPEKAKEVKLVDKDNVAELIRLLHEEAKAI